MKNYHCKRCHYSWYARGYYWGKEPPPPKRCARCRSPYWDKEPTNKVSAEGKERIAHRKGRGKYAQQTSIIECRVCNTAPPAEPMQKKSPPRARARGVKGKK